MEDSFILGGEVVLQLRLKKRSEVGETGFSAPGCLISLSIIKPSNTIPSATSDNGL
jgi:hypothetical protein